MRFSAVALAATACIACAGNQDCPTARSCPALVAEMQEGERTTIAFRIGRQDGGQALPGINELRDALDVSGGHYRVRDVIDNVYLYEVDATTVEVICTFPTVEGALEETGFCEPK